MLPPATLGDRAKKPGALSARTGGHPIPAALLLTRRLLLASRQNGLRQVGRSVLCQDERAGGIGKNGGLTLRILEAERRCKVAKGALAPIGDSSRTPVKVSRNRSTDVWSNRSLHTHPPALQGDTRMHGTRNPPPNRFSCMRITTCSIWLRELLRGGCCASMRQTFGGKRVAAATEARLAAPFRSRRRVFQKLRFHAPEKSEILVT
jgi:hypothetical protein